MAASIIPLIAGLAPTVINLIASLVHQHAPVAEATNGPGTGPVKFADVFVNTMKGLTAAVAAGTLDKVPDDATVKTIIQAVVTSMQLTGLLGASAPAPTPAPAATPAPAMPVTMTPGKSLNFSLASGQTLTLSVA